MVGGAVNWNVFPFPAKPEQAILSHMLADHITSTMYKLDFLSWCENREKGKKRGRAGKEKMGNKPWKWFKSTKRRIRTCVLLYFSWAVRFKASRNKHFLEAFSLYSRSPSKCSFFLKEIADQNQILPSSFLPHPILPYNSTCLLLHLQDSSTFSQSIMRRAML